MDGRISYKNISADLEVIDCDDEIFVIAYFDEDVDVSYDTAKFTLLINEEIIRDTAIKYARNEKEKKIITESELTIISDEHNSNKFYIEFDDFHN